MFVLNAGVRRSRNVHAAPTGRERSVRHRGDLRQTIFVLEEFVYVAEDNVVGDDPLTNQLGKRVREMRIVGERKYLWNNSELFFE